MKSFTHYIAFIAFFAFLQPSNLSAQKDTEFWFVAPEVSKGTDGNDYDRPVIFRFSSYGTPAQVTISQPANPAFPSQTFTLGANATQTLTLPPFFEFVENTPPNQVNNLGFYITATAPISAYYEIPGGICMCNPAIFSLKGKNALGDVFYVPFQTFTRNSGAGPLLLLPHAAFDIVATENNTTIDITPTKAIVGHPANTTFSITLQRGQTWSGEAVGQLATDHPTGTKVVSNKPVAITMKDDLLEGNVFNGGFCRDLIGDQIVPVKRLGTRYVVQKGLIDGTEKAFVLATADGTTVSVNGTAVATLNAGQQAVVDIIANSYFIETSSPAYVLQLTGFGCEVAAEVLPPVDCSGSTATRFVRFNTEPFYLFLVTQNGNQGSFLLNNTPGIIQASSFNVVLGTGGSFVAARIQMSLIDIPFGVSSLVSNTSGLFQLGILSGQASATGGRFGYFSDYTTTVEVYDSVQFCLGDTISVFDSIIAQPGNYTFPIGTNPACYDTIYFITAKLLPNISTLDTFSLCPNDTLYLGNLTVNQPGIYTDTLPGNPGCDTIATYLVIRSFPPTQNEVYGLCPGDSIRINNQWYTQGDTTFSYTTPALSGCDTLVNVFLNYLPLPETTKTIAFCPGDTVFVGGNAYTQPDTLFDIILPASVGCDTLTTFILQHLPLPNKTIQVKFCPGDSVLVNGLWFTEADTTVTYSAPATIGCDTIVNAVLTYLPLPEKTIEIEFCQGDTVFVGGQAYTRPDTIFDILLPATVGCDTLATYVLKYLTPDQPTTLALQCPTNISVSITAGVTGTAVSFPDPAADTNCPCPGIALHQTEGLPSGSTFPPGVSEVCFAARDSCGNESTCCFTVTVDEGKACDVKTIGCVRYELLSITRDIKGDKTYRIRITNYCADELVHAAIQLPDGVVARRPTNGSYYTAPGGNPYLVRNPNASPQHSIRFKTAGAAGIKNGESDVFQYTLPEQSQPAYIHVVTRIAPSQYFGAHLNTFFCPITYVPNPWDNPADKPAPRAITTEDDNTEVRVYPNPGDGLFYVDIVDWPSETIQARVFNAQGQLVHETRLAGNAESQTLELSTTLPEGLYILHLQDPTGRSETISLVKF